MSRTVTLMATFVLAAAALAGCTFGGNGDDDPTTTTTPFTTTATTPVTTTPPPTPEPTLSNTTFAVTTTGVPAQVKVGQKFNFTVTATGSTTYTSDHVGAHVADNATMPPILGGTRSCDHGALALPGAMMTNCTLDTPGTWHVFGHARGIEGNMTFEWWASPTPVKVRDFVLNLTAGPATPQPANTNFTFLLSINGTENATSDHIGAHFFNATTGEPSLATAAGGCAHTTGPAVNSFQISCSVPNTGTTPRNVYVRGHLLLTEGGVTLDWWSAPVEVVILPGLI